MININEIKKIRKRIGLTQNELAKLSGVSQSLIAKIESGLIDPAYSNATKILDALSNYNSKAKIKTKDIMNQKIISVTRDETIKNAILKMKRYNISQMPVIEDHKPVGFLSESIILNAMLNYKGKKIEDIMEDAPPIIPIESDIDVISNLLKFYPMILVSSKDKIKGLITKSDVLEKVYR